MTSAPDTPEERIAEYGRLFGQAFAERQRDPLSVTMTFHDKPGVAEWVQDLAQREAACCPFVDYRVEREDAHITWTISGSNDPTVQATVELWHDLPEMFNAGVEGLLDRLADQGINIERPGPRQFNIRS